MKLITEVNDLYIFRQKQILDLNDQVSKKGETNRISLQAKNLDDADIMFVGFMTRFRNLNLRLSELNQDYSEILSLYSQPSFIKNILSWFSLSYLDRNTKAQLTKFLDKWKKYEPGW